MPFFNNQFLFLPIPILCEIKIFFCVSSKLTFFLRGVGTGKQGIDLTLQPHMFSKWGLLKQGDVVCNVRRQFHGQD